MSTVTLERYRTFGFRVTFTLDGVAYDVSTWTFACKVRPEPTSSAVLLTLSVDTTNAATGVVVFTAASTATDDIAPTQKYVSVDISATNTAGTFTVWRNPRVPVITATTR